MFTKIAPQLAKHSSGFSIYVADREHAAYESISVKAVVDADFLCGIVPLYRKSLIITANGRNAGDEITAGQIIECIKEGLTFLGTACEIVDE